MPWPLLRRATARRTHRSCAKSASGSPSVDSTGKRYLGMVTAAMIVCSAFSVASAQNGLRHSGEFDKDIVTPTETTALGQKDGPALSELIAHLQAVGVNPWAGMQGSGQITYGTEDATAYGATLSILNTAGSRLDGKTATGEMSIRIHGRHGTIQEADGRKYPLPSNTAISSIVQFPLLRRADFPAANESLLDRGVITVDGVSLHRLTAECTAQTRNLGALQASLVATDLYFDPSTHLLVKSANKIRLDGTGNSEFRRVITYEDYRQVSGSMIPFRYTQTLDGQKQWTLQLSDVQLNPTLNPTFFEF